MINLHQMNVVTVHQTFCVVSSANFYRDSLGINIWQWGTPFTNFTKKGLINLTQYCFFTSAVN